MACWYPEKAEVMTTYLLNAYDRYCQGLDSGPTLQHWFKMDGADTTFDSVGSDNSSFLTLNGSTAATVFDSTGIVLNTSDSKSLRRTSSLAQSDLRFANGLGYDGDWMVGGWVKLDGGENQILFKSHLRGEQGYWRGIDVYRPNDASYLEVVFGDNAGDSRRYKTPDGSITDANAHMWVLSLGALVTLSRNKGGDSAKPERYVGITTALAQTKLYIDGVLQTLTENSGTATECVFPAYASVPNGWTGSAFDSTGDTYGGYPAHYCDELFVQESSSAITPAQILEMYRRGSGLAELAGDMNCAHIIYECITNKSWGGMRLPPAVIDEASFTAAADTFYTEGMGLSIQWVREGPVEEFIQTVVDHAGAVLRQDLSTGQFVLNAIRSDYDINDLDVLDESNVKDVTSFERAAYGELVNQITLVYRDSSINKDVPVTVQNLASIQSQGYIVSETIERPGFSRYNIAVLAAMRELRARSLPIAKGELVCNRTLWKNIYPGAVFALTWPKRNIAQVAVRVTEVDYGTLTDGSIKVSFAEDVFGLPTSSYAIDEGPVDDTDDESPSDLTNRVAYETPYWQLFAVLGSAQAADIPAGAGYLSTLAEKPNGYYTDYEVHSREGANAYALSYYGAQYNKTALLNGAIDPAVTTTAIDTSTIPSTVSLPALALIGDDPATAESIIITATDYATTMTVSRGVFDTTPQYHSDNTRVWVYSNSPFISGSIYSDTDVVDVKLIPYTTEGALPVASATEEQVTFASRKDRPLSPGNIKINNEYFPTELFDDITITWAHRNRKTFPTALQTDGNVTPEAGTTYSAALYAMPSNTLIVDVSGLTGTTWSPTVTESYLLKLEVWAVRDGYESWQKQVRYFYFTPSAFITEEGDDTLLSESGETFTAE